MAKPYRQRRTYAPETWAAAKADYMAGMSAKRVEAAHGIRDTTLYKRADREKWNRTKVWAARAEALAKEAPATRGAVFAAAAGEPEEIRSVMIADAALREALKALERGDSREAAALIKAGDAVGVFADFVHNLKARRLGADG